MLLASETPNSPAISPDSTPGDIEQLAPRLALVAGRAADQLAGWLDALRREKSATVKLKLEGFGVVEVPTVVVSDLVDLLADRSEGRTVAIVPADFEVGTTQIARLLNVSATWATELINASKIPHRKEGSKRRVRIGDVVRYRRQDAQRRRSAANDWDFLDEE